MSEIFLSMIQRYIGVCVAIILAYAPGHRDRMLSCILVLHSLVCYRKERQMPSDVLICTITKECSNTCILYKYTFWLQKERKVTKRKISCKTLMLQHLNIITYSKYSSLTATLLSARNIKAILWLQDCYSVKLVLFLITTLQRCIVVHWCSLVFRIPYLGITA